MGSGLGLEQLVHQSQVVERHRTTPREAERRLSKVRPERVSRWQVCLGSVSLWFEAHAAYAAVRVRGCLYEGLFLEQAW